MSPARAQERRRRHERTAAGHGGRPCSALFALLSAACSQRRDPRAADRSPACRRTDDAPAAVDHRRRRTATTLAVLRREHREPVPLSRRARRTSSTPSSPPRTAASSTTAASTPARSRAPALANPGRRRRSSRAARPSPSSWSKPAYHARRGPHLRHQAARGAARARAGATTLEGRDPRGLPQHGVLRRGRLRHPGRRGDLLPHGTSADLDVAAVGAARRDHPRARRRWRRPRARRGRRSDATTSCAAWPRTATSPPTSATRRWPPRSRCPAASRCRTCIEPHFVDLVVRTLLADPTFGDDRGRARRPALRRRPDGPHHRRPRAAGAGARRPRPPPARRATTPRRRSRWSTRRPGTSWRRPATATTTSCSSTSPRRRAGSPGRRSRPFVLAAAIADGLAPRRRLDGRPGDDRHRRGVLGGAQLRPHATGRRHPGRCDPARSTPRTPGSGSRSAPDRVAGPRPRHGRGLAGRRPTNRRSRSAAASSGSPPSTSPRRTRTLANGGRHVPTTVDRPGRGPRRRGGLGDRTRPPVAVLSPGRRLRHHGVLRGRRRGGHRAWRARVAGLAGRRQDRHDLGPRRRLVRRDDPGPVRRGLGRSRRGCASRCADVQGVREVTGGSIPAEIFGDLWPARWRTAIRSASSWTTRCGWTSRSTRTRGCAPRRGAPASASGVPRVLAPTETCPEPPPAPDPTSRTRARHREPDGHRTRPRPTGDR